MIPGHRYIRISRPEALRSRVRMFDFIIWATGKPARWFWRNLYGRENFRILGSVWSPFSTSRKILPLHGKLFHRFKYEYTWWYLTLALGAEPYLINRTYRTGKFRSVQMFDGTYVQWKEMKIKSSILFRKFYLCHTSISELFIVYDHYELDKNWTNRNRVFHGTFSWNI